MTTKILSWMARAQIKNSAGDPFEFQTHPFLIDPMCDMHPLQGINKAAQTGGSETLGVVKTLYLLQHMDLNVIYTLPSDSFVQDFVRTKLDPIINQNPKVFSNITGNSSVKEIVKTREEYGQDIQYSRYMILKGAFNPAGKSNEEVTSKGISMTADVLINDEASRSDQFVLQQLQSRLSNSKYGWVWLFDNPTYPGFGADAIYKDSDQRHWMITCGHCGYKQYLDWFRLDVHEFEQGTNHSFVDPDRKLFVCGKCSKDLTDYDRLNGEWVAKFPDETDKRGYWISQLSYVHHQVPKLLDLDNNPNMPKSLFNNFTLGKPYVGSDVSITRQDIIKNIDGGVNSLMNNCMGVDNGIMKHYVIGNSQGIFQVGKTKDWNTIEMLRNKYNALMVVDNNPYPQRPKEMADKYPHMVYRSTYIVNSPQRTLTQFGTAADKSSVLIRREEIIDEVVNRIQMGQFPIQVGQHELEEYIAHWTVMNRIIEQDTHGNETFRWVESGADHYAHATAYFYAATLHNRKGDVIISSLSKKSSM